MERFGLLTSIFLFLISGILFSQSKQQKDKWGGQISERFKLPDNIKIIKDIPYAKYCKQEVLLDLYFPKNSGDTFLPCIIVIHGGSWRKHDKEFFAPHAAYFAQNGFAAACIDYRLFPEVTIKECVHDVKAAVRWIRAKGRKYGIDPNKIGAFGGSAGAHLAFMLATTHKIAQLEGNGGNPGVSSRIQAVVGLAAPANIMTDKILKRYNLDKETAFLLSPVNYVDYDSAPCLLIHSIDDKGVPFESSRMLLNKYKKAGVYAELIPIHGAPHAFWNFTKWFDKTMQLSVEFFHKMFNK